MAPSPNEQALETSISQLQRILQNAPKDAASRQKLYYATQEMISELEAPGDTAQRLLHIVRETFYLWNSSFRRLTQSFFVGSPFNLQWLVLAVILAFSRFLRIRIHPTPWTSLLRI